MKIVKDLIDDNINDFPTVGVIDRPYHVDEFFSYLEHGMARLAEEGYLSTDVMIARLLRNLPKTQ